VLCALGRDEVEVFTDPFASPTGYPFKVVHMKHDPDDARRDARERVCDLGYLRVPYQTPQGTIGYRCAAEPVDQYVAKGGNAADTEGRRCLCNGLLANLGLGQRREGGLVEPPLLTSGSDLDDLRSLLDGRTRYTAAEVVSWVMGDPVVEPVVA
jgi:NAD(P)H-dependent flavin oxidoreductase YrpB (nitropropane dioxygenase family)